MVVVIKKRIVRQCHNADGLSLLNVHRITRCVLYIKYIKHNPTGTGTLETRLKSVSCT
jgi:hypothetical protein